MSADTNQKRFLVKYHTMVVKHLLVWADDQSDAEGRLMTTDSELFFSPSGEEDLRALGIEVLGDEPAGHGYAEAISLGEVDEKKSVDSNTIVVKEGE
jgi:hypothetical protein